MARGFRGETRGVGRLRSLFRDKEEEAMGSDLMGLHLPKVHLAAGRGGLTGGQRRAWVLRGGAGGWDGDRMRDART